MKNWYLIDTPDSTSGYENDVFNNYTHSFHEVLDSYAASNLILCTFDMTTEIKVKGIIQGKTSDTQLKSMERNILFPIGTCKAGMYIKDGTNIWLINGLPDNNGFYEKATLILCQYKLRWQNKKGEVIERYANIKSASQYNNGEDGNKVILLGNNQLMIQTSLDDETLNIDNKRLFIDAKKENPERVYRITRNDDVIYDYGENGGIVNLIATRDQLNIDTDNQKLRLCNYFNTISENEPSQPNTGISVINYKSLIIKSGLSSKTYEAVFKDSDGNIVENVIPDWKIENCNFLDKLTIVETNNKISISASSDIDFGEFTLILKDTNSVYSPTSINIEVHALY